MKGHWPSDTTNVMYNVYLVTESLPIRKLKVSEEESRIKHNKKYEESNWIESNRIEQNRPLHLEETCNDHLVQLPDQFRSDQVKEC